MDSLAFVAADRRGREAIFTDTAVEEREIALMGAWFVGCHKQQAQGVWAEWDFGGGDAILLG